MKDKQDSESAMSCDWDPAERLKIDACQLVLIEWEDSAQPIAGWTFLDDFASFEATRCRSVGWLIHDGSDVKALAQNVGNPDDDSAQVSGVIRIPARCVVSTIILKAAA